MSNLHRILLISEPGKDGVLDYVRGLVAHLHQKHPALIIDLAYSSKRSNDQLLLLLEQIRNCGGDAIDLRVGNFPEFGDIAACRKISRIVAKNRPQLIHAHSSKAGGLARLLKIFHPDWPPIIYTPNAYYGLSGQTSFDVVFFNFIETILGRIGVATASSPDERNFALNKLKVPTRQAILIINGIDSQKFPPATRERKLELRAQYNLPQDATIIVSIGRDNPQKNYGPLYHAMEPILAQFPHAFFYHAGAGAEELGAKYLSAANRARFRHVVFTKRLDELLQLADAFILSSRYEGLSLSVLYALGTNLKMFLTRVCGNQFLEQLGFDQVSWIDPTEDSATLAQRIERSLAAWLVNPQPPDALQHQSFLSWFNSDTQYSKMYRLYLHLVARSSS